MKSNLIPIGTVLAILSLKIKEADTHLEKFPDDHYHKGYRDAAVNIIVAVKRILELE